MLIENIESFDFNTMYIPDSGLMIMVGKNNSGKSRILKKWSDSLGEKSDYITPERFKVQERAAADIDNERNQEKQQRTYHFYQTNPHQKISEYPQADTFLELVALNNDDRNELIKWHNEYFDSLRIGKKNQNNDHSNTTISIDNMDARLAGSGSRAVLGLLSRLFDPKLEYVFIDEPEIGLEPRVQKNLFELIKKFSRGEDGIQKKKIIIATHSNLFLDKNSFANNWKIEKQDDGKINIQQIKTQQELLNASFDLLGASPSDLFFPNNILVVEGLSDQIFISKALELKYPDSGIIVHFAGGINKVDYAIPAIEQMLKSLKYLFLYKKKICVLVDKNNQQELLKKWREYLEDERAERVINLDKNGIEYFYPKTILASATGIAETEIEKELDSFISSTKNGNKADLGNLNQITKVELAEKITNQMNEGHLSELDEKIVGLLDTCINLRIK